MTSDRLKIFQYVRNRIVDAMSGFYDDNVSMVPYFKLKEFLDEVEQEIEDEKELIADFSPSNFGRD